MSETKAWVEYPDHWKMQSVGIQHSKLLPGIYTVHHHRMMGFYEKPLEPEFNFPYKLYGKDAAIVNRVVAAADHFTGNLGVLLNGLRGTGKTVTAKLISNELIKRGLPVLLISQQFEDASIVDHIAEIDQPLVIFIDEFEKIYDYHDHTLLSLMDGVMSGGHQRVFLLTTNELTVNQNLMDRPSRIRYVVNYKDLDVKVIEEIVDDLLQFPEFRAATLEYFSTRSALSIDVIKAVVSEVNLFQQPPQEFETVFNSRIQSQSVTVWSKNANDKDSHWTLHSTAATSNITEFNQDHVRYNDDLVINRQDRGRIVEVIDEQIARVKYDLTDPEDAGTWYKLRPTGTTHRNFRFIDF